MEHFETTNTPKNAKIYSCKSCYFKCSKKSDWDRHISTAKHKLKQNETTNTPKSAKLCTICNLTFNSRTTLWRHKKTCTTITSEVALITNEIISSDSELELEEPTLKEMFIKVVEQNQAILLENQEMRKLLQETIPKIGNTTTNTTTNNNSFNINFFLNEQCKDALNISDFVEQIKLQLSDLDMIGKVGYVEGMSKIFIRNLRELDVFKRPIHCSDLKRETLYVKDQNSWEKENGENNKIKRAIKQVECKNIKQIPKWNEENPDADNTDSKKHLEYHNILIESMGGSTLQDDNKKRDKIIRNIAKEVLINKTIEK